MAQIVEYLLCKHQTLSLNPRPTKKKKILDPSLAAHPMTVN
jgi:hypothetical protein